MQPVRFGKAGAILVALALAQPIAFSDAAAEMVTAYSAKPHTKLRAGPGNDYPVIYSIKEIDSIVRVKTVTQSGRKSHSASEGPPVCTKGWCEVIAGAGRYGFMPQSALVKVRYNHNPDACYLDLDC